MPLRVLILLKSNSSQDVQSFTLRQANSPEPNGPEELPSPHRISNDFFDPGRQLLEVSLS
jgi:hypothetical protein